MRPECNCPVCGAPLPEMPVTILPERGVVIGNGAFALVTGKEIAVLERLCASYPNVVSKEAIMDALYGLMAGEEPEIKIVDVFICKLRKKVQPLGVRIETAWGRGYAIGVLPAKPVIQRNEAAA